MYLIYDTETTGLPKKWDAPITDANNWPRMVQIAWQLHDKTGKLIQNNNLIISPDGFDIPFNAAKIHGITTAKAKEQGIALQDALKQFQNVLQQCQIIIGQNIDFDQNIVGAELCRTQLNPNILQKPLIDTMKSSVDFCAIPGGRGGSYKFPKLSELYQKLFNDTFDEAHNASADVNATARCFFELLRKGVIDLKHSGLTQEEFQAFKAINTTTIPSFDIQIEKQVESHQQQQSLVPNLTDQEADIQSPYFHFHNHTSFSILTATTQIDALVQKAVQSKMPAVGIVDFGNLMGAFHFVNAVKTANSANQQQILPIIGCELYLSENYLQKKFTKDNPDRRFTQVLVAKNKQGYKNLSKLSSIGYIDGYYAGYPRISKDVVVQYKQDLMAFTGSVSAEIPNLILNVGEQQAEEAFAWWHQQFKDDFYVELIRHNLEEEEHVNQVLIKFAKKYGVKIIAQNNTFYLNQEDANAHDILLCVRDGEKKDTPIGRGRDKRFGFPNNEFYFKSQQEMKNLFQDLPQAIENLTQVIQKIEPYDLAQEVLLPKFNIPKEFQCPEDKADGGVRGENAYLKHLAYQGAKKRYPELTNPITERLDFELKTIENTGYPGYFLIVQDFTSQARKMGVSVGPGRGSAAGSLVAYCTGITNVDPIKYDLLFERFLNPDRVSLPDIDIDFDDRGRDKIISWVVEKYGKDQVAQIITYGTMAGKSAIRDTGRVLDLPLPDTDRIAKKTHLKLNKLFNLSEKELKEKLSGDELQDSKEIIEIAKGNTLEAETIQQAKIIEGSIRNTGIHACGVIITPTNITDLVPITVAKDAELLVTQFDNAVVESAGLLKMDFLGLRTLTIIQDAIELIQQNHQITINTDDIPLDDEKTYEVFKQGKTIGIFQYESAGMQKHLKDLKPDKFDDLIAMNALYRPGPLQYIPNFINRKHGKEEITYDLPEMQEYLETTYGITVYQEQVMLLSQKLAGFSKGDADVLRKAMGKKQKTVLDKMKAQFMDGATAKGHPKDKLEKIWTDWEAFAQYAFNKSHSTCYALIAYHTAYLKAHYPAEFMAAVLSNNMSNIKSVSFFMEECKSMGIPVLSPDVNESAYRFSVNPEGAIRFGMGAVKGVGSAAIDMLIEEREKNGKFNNVFDFIKRINLRVVNKKTIENLVLAGGFDELDTINRAQYFNEEDGTSNIEKLIKFGQSYQNSEESAQTSLFGGEDAVEVVTPHLSYCEPWSALKRLSLEKEVVGVYISSHPLDDYKTEIDKYQNISLQHLKDNQEQLIDKDLSIIGIITAVQHRESAKNGKPFGIFSLEDYSGQYEFSAFGEDYLKNKHLMINNSFVLARVRVTKNKYSGKVYVNLTSLEMLQEVLEKYSKGLTLKLKLKLLNQSTLQQIDDLVRGFKGDKPLAVNIVDSEAEQEIKLPARKVKIEINKELIQRLDDLDFDYHIN